MAHPRHVDLICSGVRAWNAWRSSTEESIDLCQAKLTGADLTEANLRGVDLEGADLRGANLRGADLSLANLKNAALDRVAAFDLRGAEPAQLPEGFGYVRNKQERGALVGPEVVLAEASLREAQLEGVNLSGADLSRCDLFGADLSSSILERATLKGANLANARLHQAHLSGADLTGCMLQRATLSRAELAGAAVHDLEGSPKRLPQGWRHAENSSGRVVLLGPGADLTGADLSGIDATGADLTEAVLVRATVHDATLDATLSGVRAVELTGIPKSLPKPWRHVGNESRGALVGPEACLSGADLRQLDLSQGDLTGADLERASLSGSDLTQTDLRQVKLHRADLREATLTSASMEGIRAETLFAEGACLPEGWRFIQTDLEDGAGVLVGPGVDLSGVCFFGADLGGVNLRGANLTRAQLANVRLSGAHLEKAILKGADLAGADLRYAHLQDADFSEVVLDGARLSGLRSAPACLPDRFRYVTNRFGVGALVGPRANLGRADLSEAELSGTDLSDADLSEARLFGVRAHRLLGRPAKLPEGFCYAFNEQKEGTLVGPRTDLVGADLRGAHISDSDLTDADLTDARLERLKAATLAGEPRALPRHWRFVSRAGGGALVGPEADLSWAVLSGVDLRDADLRGANLSATDLDGADLRGSDIAFSSIAETDLSDARLRGIRAHDLVGVPFGLPRGWRCCVRPDGKGALVGPQADLHGVDLSRASMKEVTLVEANLEEADLTHADLSGSNLCDAKLRGATLEGAKFEGTKTFNLREAPERLPEGWCCVRNEADRVALVGPFADLSGADLSGVDLRKMDLSGLILERTNLSGARLSRVDLTGARLRGAKLVRANLGHANLEGADLTGASLSHARLSGLRAYRLSGRPNVIPSAWRYVENRQHEGALVGPTADLSGADLSGADLSWSDLSQVQLQDAKLEGARGIDLRGVPASLPDGYHYFAKQDRGFLLGPQLDLSRANLSGLEIGALSLKGANLRYANLEGLDLTEVELLGSRAFDLRGDPDRLPKGWRLATNLDDAGVLIGPGADLSGANLSGATLFDVDLSGSDFSRAKLYHVRAYDLIGPPDRLPKGWQYVVNRAGQGVLLGPKANLFSVGLAGADLRSAQLSGASLGQSNLDEADLTDADLSRATLHKTRLHRADLTNTDLTGASLSIVPPDAQLLGAFQRIQVPGVERGQLVQKRETPWGFRGEAWTTTGQRISLSLDWAGGWLTRVRCKALPTSLCLRPETRLTAWKRAVAGEDLLTGDDRFDEEVYLLADPEPMIAKLTPELRQLLRNWVADGGSLEDQTLTTHWSTGKDRLKEASERLCQTLELCLILLSSATATELLRRAIDDPVPGVRRRAAAIYLLGGDPLRPVPAGLSIDDLEYALLQLLESKTKAVRLAVIEQLGQHGTERAVSPLLLIARSFFGDRGDKNAAGEAIKNITQRLGGLRAGGLSVVKKRTEESGGLSVVERDEQQPGGLSVVSDSGKVSVVKE